MTHARQKIIATEINLTPDVFNFVETDGLRNAVKVGLEIQTKVITHIIITYE